MKTRFICMICFALMLAACHPNTVTSAAEKEKQTVGNDADDHGCKASAGYTWSEALQECIRLWEKGVKMDPVKNSNPTTASYIVFNKDSSEVELFLLQYEKHALLQRMHPVSAPNTEVWSSDKASNGLKVYQDADKFWVIEQDGKIIYRQVTEK